MIKNNFRFLHYACIFIALFLSFTPFYSVGYLLVIVLLSRLANYPKIFSTQFAKYVVSLLLLFAVVMVTGLVSWFLKLQLHPVYVLIVFLGLLSYLARNTDNSRETLLSLRTLINKSDLLSLGLAILLPAVIFANYFLPQYSNTALYQLLSNGWDNSSHVVMMETNSLLKGYAYARETGKAYSNTAGAYPQAWHLASSHFANGFGSNLFDSSQPIRVLQWYLVVLTLWFIIVAYLLARISLALLDRLKQQRSIPKIISISTFIAVSLIIQLLTISGAYDLGFANFIGLMAFMLLFISVIIDTEKSDKEFRSHLPIASIACMAAIMCWFLPFPALITSLILYIAYGAKGKKILPFIKKNLSAFIVSLFALAASAIQILIFVLFSGVSGGEQLNAIGGVYKNSELLIAVFLFAIVFVAYRMPKSNTLLNKIVIAIAPLVILITLLYLYQMVITGKSSYYFYKLLSLLALYVGVFLIPFIVTLSHSVYKRLGNTLITGMVMAGCLGIVIIGSDQGAGPWNRILQRNSVVAYSTAQVLADYLQKEDPNTTKIIALTDRSGDSGPKKNDIFNGDLVSRVTYLPPTCAFYVVNTVNPGDSQKLSAKLTRLAKCADETTDKIIVVTNNATKEKVLKLNKDNIRVVNVK